MKRAKRLILRNCRKHGTRVINRRDGYQTEHSADLCVPRLMGPSEGPHLPGSSRDRVVERIGRKATTDSSAAMFADVWWGAIMGTPPNGPGHPGTHPGCCYVPPEGIRTAGQRIPKIKSS